MKMSPCNGCTKRCASPNCHSTCEEYKDWLSEQRAERKYNFQHRYDYTILSPASEYVYRKYLKRYAGHIKRRKGRS